MFKRLAVPFLIIAFVAVGCDTVDDTTPPDDRDPDPASVFVANQGNFTDGNGSVTVYNAETGENDQNAISGLNSIVQSLSLFNGDLYVMSNTANRVDVFEQNTLSQSAQVSDVAGPRYAAHVSAEKTYITRTGAFDGSTGYVAVLEQNELVDSVDVGGNPEGIAVTGDRAFIAKGAFDISSEVAIVDTDTDEYLQTLDVECNTARAAHAVSDSYAVIVCTGGVEGTGALRVLDREGAIIDQLDADQPFTSSTSGAVSYFSGEAGELYAIQSDNAIMRVSISSDGMIGSPEMLGPFDGAGIGTVAYDPASEQLYVGQPDEDNPFTSSGTVTFFDLEGERIDAFAVGIAPAHIVLDHDE